MGSQNRNRSTNRQLIDPFAFCTAEALSPTIATTVIPSFSNMDLPFFSTFRMSSAKLDPHCQESTPALCTPRPNCTSYDGKCWSSRRHPRLRHIFPISPPHPLQSAVHLFLLEVRPHPAHGRENEEKLCERTKSIIRSYPPN